jgi:hypothetical protein
MTSELCPNMFHQILLELKMRRMISNNVYPFLKLFQTQHILRQVSVHTDELFSYIKIAGFTLQNIISTESGFSSHMHQDSIRFQVHTCINFTYASGSRMHQLSRSHRHQNGCWYTNKIEKLAATGNCPSRFHLLSCKNALPHICRFSCGEWPDPLLPPDLDQKPYQLTVAVAASTSLSL